MITKTEIVFFYIEWALIKIAHFTISVLGFPFLPIALILKYKFGVKGIWLLNDTKDGDFGDPKELEKSGHTNKPKWFKFIWWWKENHSWNFILLFNPPWYGGEVEKFLTIKNTLESTDRFDWANKDEKNYGVNHCYYGIDGLVYGRFSYASPTGLIKELQLGAAGNRYKLRLKL